MPARLDSFRSSCKTRIQGRPQRIGGSMYGHTTIIEFEGEALGRQAGETVQNYGGSGDRVGL